MEKGRFVDLGPFLVILVGFNVNPPDIVVNKSEHI